MLNLLKKAINGPEPVSRSQELPWERNNELRPYWGISHNIPDANGTDLIRTDPYTGKTGPLFKNVNTRNQDSEYPRPTIDDHRLYDEPEWDLSKLMSGQCKDIYVDKRKGYSVKNNNIDYITLDEAHDDEDRDFSHNNEQPFYGRNPYTVIDYDDKIDYYARNDIRNRPQMLKSDFEIRGHNYDPNLNRRFANMNTDFAQSIVPSRWKHDMQSIMPLDQLRDHTHNGKLYLPGEEPTNDDPLAVEYRPEAKTMEELYLRSKPEAEGRANIGLVGEKIFYHQKIHHLKRKTVDALEDYNFNGYMTGAAGQRVDGSLTLKDEAKVLPDFEYYGGVGGSSGVSQRVEGFQTKNHANRGHGRETKGVILGATGNRQEGMINSKKSASQNRRKNVERYDGMDDGIGINDQTRGNRVNGKVQLDEEKTYAVMNSRPYGNVVGENRSTIDVSRTAYDALTKNKQHEYTNVSRIGNIENQETQGTMIAGKNDKSNNQGLLDKANLSERAGSGYQLNVDSQGNILRNDIGMKRDLRKTIKSEIDGVDLNRYAVDGDYRASIVQGSMTNNATRKSTFEGLADGNGMITGEEQHALRSKNTKAAPKKSFIEGLARIFGNVVDRLSGNGYLITNHEARETKRSQIVNNYAGAGAIDMGIVSHQGVRNIDWHKNRNRKQHTSETAARCNGPQKQDLGWGADQIKIDRVQHKMKEVRNQVINPGARTLHVPVYAGEGIVHRQGTNRKVERSINDGVIREHGFINARYTNSGIDTQKRINSAARRASRKAARIAPA